MKKLALCAILCAAASQAVGCIIINDDDDFGEVDVTWDLLAAADDSVVGCPPDGITAEVVSIREGGVCPGPDCFVDCFLCGSGGGLTAALPPDNYDIFVRITDLPENVSCAFDAGLVIAESNVASVNVGGNAITPVDFDFYVDGGFFSVEWDIVDLVGDPVACNDPALQADGVGVLSTLASPSTAFDDIFTCADGAGVTSVLPLGSYTVAIDLVDDMGAAISDAAIRNADIVVGNDQVPLTPVEFEVDI